VDFYFGKRSTTDNRLQIEKDRKRYKKDRQDRKVSLSDPCAVIKKKLQNQDKKKCNVMKYGIAEKR
jgi:hypothetical protein